MKYETGVFLYNGRKNVLWGAGGRGIRTLLQLAVTGIPIALFCDADSNKWNTHLYNKKVVSPEIILENHQEYNIIIAVENPNYFVEIENKLLSCNLKSMLWTLNTH